MSGPVQRQQPQQGKRATLPLGHKPRRRRARGDDRRAAVTQSWTAEPTFDDEPDYDGA